MQILFLKLFLGRSVRFFSAEKVANEIELLYNEYNYNHIYIYDDLFSMNKQRLQKIILLLKQKKLLGKIKFSVYGRANGFDKETAKLLKEMNVKSITFGFETGSQKVLNFLKGNGITVEDGINALKLSRNYGLNPGGFFMIGSPTESKKDLEETYNFIKNYCQDNFIVYQTLAFPGTDFWTYALENKILDKDFYEKKQAEFIDTNTDILLSKNITKEEFEDYFQKIKGLTIKKKKIFFKKLLKIRPRHLKLMMTKEFLNKAFNLRKSFLKRI